MQREPYLNSENRDRTLERWLQDLDGLRGRRLLPIFSRPALLVLDVQRLFCDPASPAFLPAWPMCRPTVDQLITAFRDGGWPVWYTRHVHRRSEKPVPFHYFYDRLIRPDDPLAELIPDYAVMAEQVFEKDDFSAWSRPDLAEKMAACDVLVLAGTQTQLCVAATAIAAAGHEVTPVVTIDGCAAPNERAHLSALHTLGAGHAFLRTGEELLANLREMHK